MRASAGRAVVFKLAPQALPGPAGQGWIDVAQRMPGLLVELDRAGDGIAEKQGPLRPGRKHYAQVAGGMPRREHSGNTPGDRGVTVERPEPARVRGGAPPRPDVREHLTRTRDEVTPIGLAGPDRSPAEHRLGVQAEQPADVVSVQVVQITSG